MIGAVVGGVSARKRKEELEKLNEQLRMINMSLRQQARAGTLYAPNLTYAPSVASNGSATAAAAVVPVVESPPTPAVAAPANKPRPAPAPVREPGSSPADALDDLKPISAEPTDPLKQALKEGKR